jgi:methionyl-tRNA formyltransferase
MKNPNKTLVFFGNERIATGVTTNTPILRELIEAGYTIAAIIVNQTEQESGRKRDLEVAALAEEHQIPLLSPLKPVEIANQLTAYKADAAVLVAYGKIIPQSVIDIFPSGIINVHPSLLPKYRGSTPIESAILNGDPETGVTIMRLTSTMDAGPIYAQSIVALKSDQNKQQLADELSDIGAKMIRSLLPDILDGSLTAINQDDENATYSTLLNKKNGIIDWQSKFS